MKENKKDKKIYLKEILCFVLGIILSICISICAIYCLQDYLFSKQTITVESENGNETDGFSQVQAAFLEEVIQGNIEKYFSDMNNTYELSKQDIEDISEYVSEKVINGISNTGSDIDIDVIRESISNGVQEGMENAVTISSQYTDEQSDNQGEKIIILERNMESYVDDTVVSATENVLSMSKTNIVVINQKLEGLKTTYENFYENTETTITEISAGLNGFEDSTQENFETIQNYYQDFSEEYNTYVENTSTSIDEIKAMLPEYVTIQAFENFLSDFEEFQNATTDALEQLSEATLNLEDKKADKESLQKVGEELSNLKEAYESFSGADGAFEQLSDRVTEIIKIIDGNSTNISEITEKVSGNNTEINNLKNQVEELSGQLESVENDLKTKVTSEDLLNEVYPIGSMYMSLNNVSPATFLGGTWERVTDTVLIGAGNKYAVGSTGGTDNIKLSAQNIPSLTSKGYTSTANVGTSANGAGNYSLLGGSTASYTGTTSTNGEHTHGIDVGVHYVPFDYHDGSNYGDIFFYNNSMNTLPAGNHEHTFTVPNLSVSGYVSIGNHNHTLTVPSLSVTTTYTNNAVQSINTLNPYTAVYMWKRVA